MSLRNFNFQILESKLRNAVPGHLNQVLFISIGKLITVTDSFAFFFGPQHLESRFWMESSAVDVVYQTRRLDSKLSKVAHL